MLSSVLFKRALALLAAAAFGAAAMSGLSNAASEKQHYIFMAFSNPVPGKEKEYLDWYTGQHIHDLLAIEGFVGAQFFKVTDAQNGGTQPQKYLMIWDWENDGVQPMFDRIKKGIQGGTTVLTPAFDGPTYNNMTMAPLTRHVTAAEVKGKTNAEIQAIVAVKN